MDGEPQGEQSHNPCVCSSAKLHLNSQSQRSVRRRATADLALAILIRLLRQYSVLQIASGQHNIVANGTEVRSVVLYMTQYHAESTGKSATHLLLFVRYTVLHIAAGLGNADMLELLLQHAAATALINDADNSDKATPLHAAAMSGSANCVKLLLQHGGDASVAGNGQLLAWELVPSEDNSPAAARLRKQLQEAAGVEPGTASKVKQRPESSPSSISSAETAIVGRQGVSTSSKSEGEGSGVPADPVEAYAAQFAKLNTTEQGRKIDTFARMSEAELLQLDFLTDQVRQAISQVRLAAG